MYVCVCVREREKNKQREEGDVHTIDGAASDREYCIPDSVGCDRTVQTD